MKKKIFVVIGIVTVLFVITLIFGKSIVGKLLLKETQIEFTPSQRQNVTVKKGDFLLYGKYLNENILWQIIGMENGKPLLQTHYVISFKAFDAAHGNSSDIGKLGKAQWETSALKKWLNTRGQVSYSQGVPNKNNVFNGKNSYENEKGFLSEENFTDYELQFLSNTGVFLLSKEQLSKINQKDRLKTATKSAILQDESSYIILSGRKIWYWTSTAAGTNRTSVTTVTSGGGFYKANAFDSVTGVVPALYFNNVNVTSISGNGSKEKPYVVG